MSTIILLPEPEIEKLKKLSGRQDQDALVIGLEEMERRGKTYSDKEATHLGWKLIREELKAAGKLPREKKATPVQETTVPTIEQIKEQLFKAWLEGKLKFK